MTSSPPVDSGAGPVLAQASETAPVAAPIGAVDLAAWIMTLSNEAYRQCAPGEHKGCGASSAPDGRPMSICTETVGDNLMIQHYVGEVMTPDHCRMVSLTDVFASSKWTTVEVTWEVSVVAAGEDQCTFTNSIVSRATPEFLAALKASGASVEAAAQQRASGVADHNRRETPAFARSIERLARSGRH